MHNRFFLPWGYDFMHNRYRIPLKCKQSFKLNKNTIITNAKEFIAPNFKFSINLNRVLHIPCYKQYGKIMENPLETT